MKYDSLKVELTQFFKTASHLWGRCPRCDELFRLSEAAISFGSEPPRDWLNRLQRQQSNIAAKQGELDDWQATLAGQESELKDRERDVGAQERHLEGRARAIATDRVR